MFKIGTILKSLNLHQCNVLNELKYGNDEIQCFFFDALRTRSALPTLSELISQLVSQEKVGANKKLAPAAVPVHSPPQSKRKTLSSSDPPTLPWSDDVSILQFG